MSSDVSPHAERSHFGYGTLQANPELWFRSNPYDMNNTIVQFLLGLAPSLCELMGTFILTFSMGCCFFVGDPAWNAIAVGCALTVLIYASWPVSGGHFNPAVTYALFLVGKVRGVTAICYIVLQYAGAFLAAVVVSITFRHGAEIVKPVPPFRHTAVGVVEIIYTMMLCFVVTNCAASTRNNPKLDRNQFFALSIGFTIVAGGYAAGGVSGAIFNPAVATALDTTSPGDGSANWPLYTLYEFVGATFASGFFIFCREEEYYGVAANSMVLHHYVPNFMIRCFCEFIGTFIIMFTVGCCVVTSSPSIPMAASAALMCMVYSLANISGGHFNPAVTLAVVCSARNKCTRNDGLAYVVSQLLAGLLAGVAVSYIHRAGPSASIAFGVRPHGSHDWWTVFLMELVFTFLLAYVVLGVATVTPESSPSKQNFRFGLAIGFSAAVGGIAAGSVSGGILNPAVAFGLATEGSLTLPPKAKSSSPHHLARGQHFVNFLVFAVFELLGGALAAATFRVTHAREYEKQKRSVNTP